MIEIYMLVHCWGRKFDRFYHQINKNTN